ncbi:hypothetical protein V6N13_046959 [Hibiscus sabdariffa]
MCGLSIQAWFKESFRNITSHWGSLVCVEEETLSPNLFERGRILIDTNLFRDIAGRVYRVWVVETDQPVMFECQCAYGDVESESHSSSEGGEYSFPEPIEVTPKIDNNGFVQKCVDEESLVETMVPESLTPMAMDIGTYRSKDCTVETCVPDSFGMLGTEQCNRMWAGNQRVDLRVMDNSQDWLANEVVGLVSRSGEACADHSVVDYVHKVDSVSVQHVGRTQVEVDGVKKADIIDHMRSRRKVRSVYDIMLQFLTPGNELWQRKKSKKARGIPWKNNLK